MDHWARDTTGATVDWFEFVADTGDDDKLPRRFMVNVSFLLSRWKCVFGQGCPGVLITGALEDVGCCQIGVHIGEDEFDRVHGYVAQLTPADADHIDKIRQNRWFYQERDQTERELGYTRRTVVKGGACIFANRAGGPAGRVGCALHLLADRLGLHPSETKPDICWQIPIAVTDELDEQTGQTTVTIDGTAGRSWGSIQTGSLRHPGWWCTETSDAYVADQLVFRTHEVELRKLIGDAAYDTLSEHLMGILAQGGRRTRMPGEEVHLGQPLIPVMVKQRAARWAETGKQKRLDRSMPYLNAHPDAKPDNMKSSTVDGATAVPGSHPPRAAQ